VNNKIKLIETKIQLLMASGSMEEALQAFEQLLALDPSPENVVNKTSLLVILDRKTEALEFINKEIANNPDPEYYKMKSMLQIIEGSKDEAIDTYDQLIALEPSLEAVKNKILMLFIAGRTNEALEFLDEKLSITPNTELFQLKVTLLISSGFKDAALSALDDLISFDNNPEYRQLKATLLFAEGRSQEAIECLDNAISDRDELSGTIDTNTSMANVQISKSVEEDSCSKVDEVQSIFANFSSMLSGPAIQSNRIDSNSFIYQQFRESINRMTEKVKTEERDRILSNLSHSIKNLIRSVIDPLTNLKTELPQKSAVIDNALRGANLIREMVNSVSLSYKASVDDLIWDAKRTDAESIALGDILQNSIRYSIGNMFDFRYFPAYAGNYFPRNLNKVEFQRVKDRWDSLSSIADMSMITEFVKDNMFTLDIELSEVSEYRLGNEKSSAIKLMILFQEIIFNAVKYASFVARKDRFIEIRLIDHEQNLSLTVSNSYRPEVQAKTTGVGKLVIENFAKVLDCQPEITTTDQVYTIRMEFNNIWRNHAQDPLH